MKPTNPIPDNLVVVSSHGEGHVRECLESLGDKYEVLVIPSEVFPHYTTGKYLWAYWNHPAKNYLFMQDSMVSTKEDYLTPFKEVGSPCAWVNFPMMWDDFQQKEWAKYMYEGNPPDSGIFGPIFYVSREHLDTLRDKQLLPPVPMNKAQAQGTERLWAWAFQNAGIEVKSLHSFSPANIQNGLKPFKKTFVDRQ